LVSGRVIVNHSRGAWGKKIILLEPNSCDNVTCKRTGIPLITN
jgi:hypothetical protein